jgi:glycosyltransferase involved in cell wall biosynthesis
MRVLFLTHSYPRHRGDAPGSFLLRLAIALEQQGVKVSVVAPSAPGLAAAERLDGIPVERFRYAPRRYERLAYTGTMVQEVRETWSGRLALLGFLGAELASSVRASRHSKPDLVHAHWWFPGGLVGSWTASLVKVPLVTTMHGSDVRLARNTGAARPAFRRVMHKSAAVTTVSRWLARQVEDMLPSVHPVVAPMPVDTTLFTPGGARSEHRLLFVGRLNAQKGIEHLIAALAAMRTPAMLDVVGDGPDRDALMRQAHQAGVADRITWLGALPQPELPALYRRAAAVVIPSIEEGLGLVAAEAQLCEAPVVASDSGGLPDIVRDGHTGVLVPPADSAALAAALDDLLSRPDRGRSLGEAGRLHALDVFAPESAARRYAALYHSIIAPSTSS